MIFHLNSPDKNIQCTEAEQVGLPSRSSSYFFNETDQFSWLNRKLKFKHRLPGLEPLKERKSEILERGKDVSPGRVWLRQLLQTSRKTLRELWQCCPWWRLVPNPHPQLGYFLGEQPLLDQEAVCCYSTQTLPALRGSQDSLSPHPSLWSEHAASLCRWRLWLWANAPHPARPGPSSWPSPELVAPLFRGRHPSPPQGIYAVQLCIISEGRSSPHSRVKRFTATRDAYPPHFLHSFSPGASFSIVIFACPGEGIGYPLQDSWASLVAQLVKNPPAMRETWVPSQGWENPLEKGKVQRKRKVSSPWPGEFHGLYSPWGRKELDTTEQFSLHFTLFRKQFLSIQ